MKAFMCDCKFVLSAAYHIASFAFSWLLRLCASSAYDSLCGYQRRTASLHNAAIADTPQLLMVMGEKVIRNG